MDALPASSSREDPDARRDADVSQPEREKDLRAARRDIRKF